MKRIFKLLLLSALSIYLLACVAVYCMQNKLLFPAYAAQPVAEDWAPRLSASDTQAMITGQCGQLHVVKWATLNDKGSVMIFHGNGESVVSVEPQVPTFQKLGYSVMTWDYAGYGKSANCWFNENDLLSDSESAYQWLARRVPASKIVLYGHSVGTGLALHVASQHPVKEVLLVSPYDALSNVAKDHIPFYMPLNLISHLPIQSKLWIGQVKSKIRAIHGLNDTLIKPERPGALFKDAKRNAQIDWIAKAGHNDITFFDEYHQWLVRQLLIP